MQHLRNSTCNVCKVIFCGACLTAFVIGWNCTEECYFNSDTRCLMSHTFLTLLLKFVLWVFQHLRSKIADFFLMLVFELYFIFFIVPKYCKNSYSPKVVMQYRNVFVPCIPYIFSIIHLKVEVVIISICTV